MDGGKIRGVGLPGLADNVLQLPVVQEVAEKWVRFAGGGSGGMGSEGLSADRGWMEFFHPLGWVTKIASGQTGRPPPTQINPTMNGGSPGRD